MNPKLAEILGYSVDELLALGRIDSIILEEDVHITSSVRHCLNRVLNQVPRDRSIWPGSITTILGESSNSRCRVADAIGFLKGKSAVRIHRNLLKERRMTRLHFWSPGYCVSTVGFDEGRIRHYTREQEQREAGQGDLDLK